MPQIDFLNVHLNLIFICVFYLAFLYVLSENVGLGQAISIIVIHIWFEILRFLIISKEVIWSQEGDPNEILL